jgi:hypothetical protein
MSDKITKLARGQDCQIRLPGCLFDTSTVVPCHYRLSGLCGMGLKPISILVAWGCHFCHAVCDGRASIEGWTKEQIRLAHAEGVFRTQNQLVSMGKIKT